MSDYTKITDFTAKDSAEAVIEGIDHDNEFSAIASMSATKMDKTVPAAANSVAGLTVGGLPYDTTVLVSDMSAAIAGASGTGDMKMWPTASAPSGWAFCDGSSYTTAAQADLFAVIGYTFGGSGANFNVPDLRGRVVIGKDNMGGTSANRVTDTEADTLGGVEGAETVTLDSTTMPAHTHTASGTTSSNGAHTHSAPAETSDGTVANSFRTADGTGDSSLVPSSGAHTHTYSHTTDSTGSGNAHANVQPYIALNFVIKL